MCRNCGSSFPTANCNCSSQCSSNGCPIQLDFECVIYHKRNQGISGLTNLGLANGTTLDIIIEAIDVQLGQLNVDAWVLPYLRDTRHYVLHTLRQYGEAVDAELTALVAAGVTPVPITINNSKNVIIVASGTLDHTLSADVAISAFANNQLVNTQPDGLYVVAQTLNPDYTNGTIGISDGNTVDLKPFFVSEGFLGNQATTDPTTAVDGQFWYRVDTDELHIKLNGVVRNIPIV